MKFERDEGSFEISLCVCSIRVFTKFSGDPYYEPLVWFMITYFSLAGTSFALEMLKETKAHLRYTTMDCHGTNSRHYCCWD